MSISGCMGFGAGKIIQSGREAVGTVTAVKTCYWLKVNTKAVRLGPMDGAKFPHIVHFTYEVDGMQYKGSRFYNWNKEPPLKGGVINVYFDLAAPQKYAVRI